MTAQTPFPARLRLLAEEEPDRPMVTDSEGTWSRRELDELSNRWARDLAALGVRQGDLVSITLPSNRQFVAAAWAAWKVGATPQPLSARIAPNELREVVALAGPAVIAGRLDEDYGVPTWQPSLDSASSAEPLEPVVTPFWKAPTSGGSTGRPKVILANSPAVAEPVTTLLGVLDLRERDTVLIPAPLHHNAPFLMTSGALLGGGHVVLMERFDPVRALELIGEHRVGWIYAVPTIMSRIAKLPAGTVDTADLSSVHTLVHMAAPCADWLKRWWIDKLGTDAVIEIYAGTEAQAVTRVTGTEWLDHPGSVGRPVLGEFRILGEDGAELPAGEVGEIFLKAPGEEPTYRYLGAEAKTVEGGWESLGDLGSLDADGFLYLSDRKTDMVLVGGVNVYPAEIEAALDAHPAVASSCVVGLPDEDLGNTVHAVVHLSSPVADEELHAWLRDRLTSVKRPRTFGRSETPLRDEAGKVRRSEVRARALAG